MKTLLLTGVVALISTQALAQARDAAGDASLATPTGHEISAGISGYTYREPGDQAISIHGRKITGDYLGARSLNKDRHLFAQAELRGTFGDVTYDGWCSPFLIAPDVASPNGYQLGLGDPSPCSESGDRDWSLEGRFLAGKDLIGPRWGWSPYSGLGVRHLSNGTTGTAGYRTDEYLYVPVGLTARTNVAAHRVLSFTVEYDRLVHGWQKTRDSQLGGGDIPATPTAPGFTIDGFTDVSFSQAGGWALRVSSKYQVTKHWSVEPYFVHWSVNASAVNDETATFTVNGVTAREQLGAYEPFNVTNQFGVRLGLRF